MYFGTPMKLASLARLESVRLEVIGYRGTLSLASVGTAAIAAMGVDVDVGVGLVKKEGEFGL